MKIDETLQVPASIEKVWAFIADPNKMAPCLPSVESVAVLDEKHYEVVMKQKIGFISATFKIQTEVLEKQPPFLLVLSNRGKTILGAQGSLKSTDTISLKAISDQATEVRVLSELTLGGQLAVLGAKLIESKSKELFAEATGNLREKLGGGSATVTAPRRQSRVIAFWQSLLQSLKGLFSRKWMVKQE